MTTDLVLNKNKPVFRRWGDLNPKDFDPISVKNCKIEDYLSHGSKNAIHSFIEKMQGEYFREKNVLVDVKFHDIRENVYPCLPGWHTDGSFYEHKSYVEEKYLLYITGDVCSTEFCLDEVEFPLEKQTRTSMLNHNAKEIVSLPFGSFVLYNSTNIHRGTKSTQAGHRLLIRLMSSPRIKGSSYEQALFTPLERK